MHNLKEHIIFKILLIALVGLLLMPSFKKLEHLFCHQKHEVCKDHNKTHIHKKELDCDCLKFQLLNNFLVPKEYVSTLAENTIQKVYNSKYKFLYSYKTVTFLLRGPPALV